MTLPPPVRHAVLEVVRRLRDPMRECHVDSIVSMVLAALRYDDAIRSEAVLNALRVALGRSPVPGSLARWARGKSREEAAQALERVATSESSER